MTDCTTVGATAIKSDPATSTLTFQLYTPVENQKLARGLIFSCLVQSKAAECSTFTDRT